MTEEYMDYETAYSEAQKEIERLKRHCADLEAQIGTNGEVAAAIEVRRPIIDVIVRKYVIEADDKKPQGRIAILLSEGFLDKPRRIQDLYPEFRARGWMKQTGPPTPLNLPMAQLTELGFLRMVGWNTYQSVPGMKVNVKEVEGGAA
jgi:hypothetical protein